MRAEARTDTPGRPGPWREPVERPAPAALSGDEAPVASPAHRLQDMVAAGLPGFRRDEAARRWPRAVGIGFAAGFSGAAWIIIAALLRAG